MWNQPQRKQTHPLHGMDGPEPRRRVWRNGQAADWMKLVDNPEAQIKSIDKDGKWVVVTRERP